VCRGDSGQVLCPRNLQPIVLQKPVDIKTLRQLQCAIIKGNSKKAAFLTEECLGENLAPSVIIEQGLLKGLEVVGQKWKTYEYFIPNVLVSAMATKLCLNALSPALKPKGIRPVGKAVGGAVKGDVHDNGIYEVPMRTLLISEILHTIISHRSDDKPLTLEAGIVRVADTLDMEEGRSRIPFQEGKIDIHSVSAASIEQISIEKGEDKPIRIVVKMSNSSGIFQLDELLKNKLEGSGLEIYVDIDASIKGETEKKLIHTFRI